MTAANSRFAAKAVLAATMALALAACGKKDDAGSATALTGEPIAKIAAPASSGRVSYEVRFFMLNALDVQASLLAPCGAQEAALPLAEQFWGWQKNMFTNLQSNEAALNAAGQLPPEQRFAAIAKAGGMDTFFAARGVAADQAKTCLADTAKATKLVEATNKAGEELNITGTPTFFLNGTKLDVNTWEAVKVALEKAGAR